MPRKSQACGTQSNTSGRQQVRRGSRWGSGWSNGFESSCRRHRHGPICGSGNTKEEVLSNLLAGRSGVGPVNHFDASAFPVRIASEVKNFDPFRFIEKKRSKMDFSFTTQLRRRKRLWTIRGSSYRSQ